MGFDERVYRLSPAWIQQMLLNVHALQIEHHRYGRRMSAILTHLVAHERTDLAALRELQDALLRKVVRAASDRSPYYRSTMDRAGVKVSDIRGVQDLPRLPLLTKETVRSRGAELLTATVPQRGWLNGHTSGTTGSPLSLWYDRETCIFTNAVDRQQKLWGGMQGTDWGGMFLGRVVVAPNRRRPPFWKVNFIQRQIWFSSFHMSEEYLPRYVQEIARRRLQFLEGYPSTLFILARHLARRRMTLPMRAVFTSSETLHAVQREAIEAAFECRVFDFYGLAERVIFGAECETHSGKHLAELFGYTEIVDDAGAPVPDGKLGYLVGTSLQNHAMPMIRYRTRDMSRMISGPCACGRTPRRLQNVTTKAEDIIVLPDGRMISPSILTHPFKPFDQLVKSQIVQTALDHLIVRLVPSDTFSDRDRAALIAGIRERVGHGVSIDCEVVEDIPNEPSGKYRWVISPVEHACSVAWEDGDRAPATVDGTDSRP